MTRSRAWRVSLLFMLALMVTPLPAVATQLSIAGAPQAAPVTIPSTLAVSMPKNDATLTLDGRPIAGEGEVRDVIVPPAPRGSALRLTLTATWNPTAYTTMTRSIEVTLEAGGRIAVDLRTANATDRARVDYVPTSEAVVEGMVALAGITATDTVFEPGCGDARITIAAVAAGARRGVGIDIDADRVAESRANVVAAGLSDRVEIRLGDALDIADLADASVVFLFMGDDFNALMRPLLWKHLAVGTRVVSHRFAMGDWAPDRVVHVGGVERWDTRIYLWTITEAVKRRAQ